MAEDKENTYMVSMMMKTLWGTDLRSLVAMNVTKEQAAIIADDERKRLELKEAELKSLGCAGVEIEVFPVPQVEYHGTFGKRIEVAYESKNYTVR